MSQYLNEIHTYFNTLCSQHTEILHSPGTRMGFFRLQSEGAIDNLPNNLTTQLVQMLRFSGRSVGEFDANKMQQNITLRFLRLLAIPSDSDKEDAINDCMGDCYLVMLDFISRMKYDLNAAPCGWLRFVDFQSLSWFEVGGPVLERHYGWDLNIPFYDTFPAYRSGKWQIPP